MTMSKLPLATCPAPQPRTYWIIEDLLLGGAYAGHPDPRDHQQRLEGLFKAGVRTIVNPMEVDEVNQTGKPFVRYEDLFSAIATEAGQRANCLRFPIVDGHVTTVESMRNILDAIDCSIENQRTVYVHCFGGMGRTGTVVSCWLRRHGYATRADVFDVLQTLRNADVARASWTVPENDTQRRFVLEWKH
jgi:protein tyrosine/serine phosphatase